jgi:ribulose-5-phosphate 4-epimerase/fuculose-1-phosphate aldolase
LALVAVNNHLTARLPGSADHFLINCLGIGFDEVTASSLVAITGDGAVVRAGSHGDGINKAGYVAAYARSRARAPGLNQTNLSCA